MALVPFLRSHSAQASVGALQLLCVLAQAMASQMDNAAVYWLILATSITSVTSAILFLLQKCCGEFWGNMHALCFQKFAAMLELRAETFREVTNMSTFPRILGQLGLETFQVTWLHDANAQTGDYLQWGWLRLPTKSYIIAFLAVCGVTHYKCTFLMNSNI